MAKRNGKGILTPLADAALNLPGGPPAHGPTPWKILQARVLERAGYRCEACKRPGKLVVMPKGANPDPTPRSYLAMCADGCPEGAA